MYLPVRRKCFGILQSCINEALHYPTFMNKKLPSIMSCLQQWDDKLLIDLGKAFYSVRFKHNEYLFRSNKPMQYVYLMESGTVCKLVHLHKKNSVNDFFFSGDFIGNVSNYIDNINSHYCIRAHKNVHCWAIPCADLVALANKYPKLLMLMFKLQSEIEKRNDHIKHCLQNLSVEEHYRYLWAHYPFYFKKLPMKYITSYLNTSKSTFKRIHSRFVKNCV